MLVPSEKNLINNKNSEDIRIIEIDNINDDVEIFKKVDLADAKSRDKFIKIVERMIRNSFEYRSFLGYMKNNLDITKCTFMKDVDISQLKKTKLEFHHYPFTLYTIVDTVIRKHEHENESINPFDIAKEVMELHYKFNVGLVPLSKTVHQLVHSGKKFVNLKYVYGKYERFKAEYCTVISDEELANLDKISELTRRDNSGELEENILKEVRTYIKMKGIESPKAIEIVEQEIS